MDETRTSDGLLIALGWAIRHWYIVLLLVGGLIYLMTPKESDDPRPGYVDTGETITSYECTEQNGQLVGDVCYLP